MPYADPASKAAWHQRTKRQESRRRWKRHAYRSNTQVIADIQAEGVENVLEIGSALAIETRQAIYFVHTEIAGHKRGELTGIRISW